MLLKLALFISIFSLGAGVARAKEDPIVADFKKMAKVIPTNLQKLGYEKIGNISLSQILQAQSEIPVASAVFFRHEEPTKGDIQAARSTAEWIIDSSGRISIKVDRDLWPQASNDERSVIGVHEYLGPEGLKKGFNDHGYFLSLGLWTLSLPETQKNLSPSERQSLEKSISQEASSGVIIGVGGGGDQEGVSTRILLIRRSIKLLEKAVGENRGVALQALSAAFRMSVEVGRTSPHSVFQNREEVVPNSVWSQVQLLEACQAALKRLDLIPMVYQSMLESSPEIAKKLGSSDGLVRFCRETVAGNK